MKVYQILENISYGDGVGNDTLAIQKILKEAGYKTKIYANYIDKRVTSYAKPIKKLPKIKKDDIIIYHLSTGTDLNLKTKEWNCRIIYRYHNVTPPYFFEGNHEILRENCANAVEQVKQLNTTADYCLADSEFNRQDLIDYGYTCKIDTLPILIPFDDYKVQPNTSILNQYDDDWVNIIFVGRVAPNKKHEDIIKAFTYYKKNINKKTRLILVGVFEKNGRYFTNLQKYTSALGVKDVIFTGHTKFEDILAYYKLADIFLCMSEHEGFCIPLVEAMHFNVPIIAYNSTAIPYTMQNKGALVDTKDPVFISLLIDKIINDEALRNKLIKDQEKVLETYQFDILKTKFLLLLNNFINEGKL